MNLPNKLTVFRIILVPFFVAMFLNQSIGYHYVWAGILFAIAAYTDHLDGMLARKNNQITDFGKFLDPIADKILVVSALVCFVQFGLADTWCVILIIAREFMVTSLRLVAVDSGVVLAANNWGKTKTVSQMIAIVLILVFQSVQEMMLLGNLPAFTVGGATSAYAFNYIGHIMIWIATFFTVLSGVIYMKQNISVINTTK